MNLTYGFIFFIMYSFLGWLVEMIVTNRNQEKIVNRGFLIGPYCPIYGVGGIIATLFLYDYRKNIFITFGMSIILFAILEYFTSYIMEKLFKARWWDYSQNKYNINGRICLETLIPFGLLGCVAIYIINPLMFYIINIIDLKILHIIAIVLFIIFLIDFIVSLKIINSFKNTAISFLKKDNTEEISKKVKDVLLSKSVLTKRLIESFPKAKAVITNNFDILKMKFELKQTKKELRKAKKELKKARKVNKKMRR